MTTDQERWARVRVQLRGLLGEEIFTSWFARMEIEGIEIDTVKVSVPTRFLGAGCSRIMPSGCSAAGRMSFRPSDASS